jgi:hypothetical protein
LRFQVLYLDNEGFADFAEYLEATNFEVALKFVARRIERTDIKQTAAGYVIAHADSDFMRRYMRAGGIVQTRAERFDKEEMREQFPHLFRSV